VNGGEEFLPFFIGKVIPLFVGQGGQTGEAAERAPEVVRNKTEKSVFRIKEVPEGLLLGAKTDLGFDPSQELLFVKRLGDVVHGPELKPLHEVFGAHF
jgi:hypothetical protein